MVHGLDRISANDIRHIEGKESRIVWSFKDHDRCLIEDGDKHNDKYDKRENLERWKYCFYPASKETTILSRLDISSIQVFHYSHNDNILPSYSYVPFVFRNDW